MPRSATEVSTSNVIHLLAPTEHDLHEHYRSIGRDFKVSSLPERHGSDVVVLTSRGLVGYQRKTLPDLQSSLLDGRLYYELAQFSATASLTYAFLIIESNLARTTDGQLLNSTLTINSVRTLIAKFHAFGVGYIPSDSIRDTAAAIEGVSRYVASDSIDTIKRPKQLKNEWGRITSDSYALFLLQSFPGIGPKQARAIVEHFGRVPIKWDVGAKDLEAVPGLGPKSSARLIAALDPNP